MKKSVHFQFFPLPDFFKFYLTVSLWFITFTFSYNPTHWLKQPQWPSYYSLSLLWSSLPWVPSTITFLFLFLPHSFSKYLSGWHLLSSQVTHSSNATLSERLLWPLTLQISNISLCLIFFRAFITIRNALVQNFIFCLPPQLCKFHDDRNAVFTTAIQDCDTFEETFLSRLEKTCVIPQQTFLKLSMKHLRALLVGSSFFYFFFFF